MLRLLWHFLWGFRAAVVESGEKTTRLTATRFTCGDNASCLDGVAWFSGNSGSGQYEDRKQVVRGKPPNAFALYDMTGNVWEWVSDRYDSVYYADSPPANPQGPAEGDSRVKRGGSFLSLEKDLRVSARSVLYPWEVSNELGFRCARSK